MAGAEATPAAASIAAPAAPAAALGPRGLALSAPVNLDAALAAAGYKIPPGAAVYAAKVTKEGGALAYDDFEAGAGALGTNFWPASSIKVLAAIGALEFVGQQGFTGAATVAFGNGAPRTIRSIYDAAVRISDNGAYDLLVEIAGVDYLNKEFLSPARGFPKTVIQRSYTVGREPPVHAGHDPDRGDQEGHRPGPQRQGRHRLPPGPVLQPLRDERVGAPGRAPQRDPSGRPVQAGAGRRRRADVGPAGGRGLVRAGRGQGRRRRRPDLRQARSGARAGTAWTSPSSTTARASASCSRPPCPERQGGCPALVNLATAVLRYLTK